MIRGCGVIGKDFDTELLSLNRRIRDGYSYMISNLSKIIAIVTMIVAGMLVFTDIEFLGFDSRELTTTLLLILIFSYVVYFSLEESGEKLYEESEEYKKLSEKYTRAVEEISLERLPELREYCERYVEYELLFRRRSALLRAGYTAEDYDAFCRGEIAEGKRKRDLNKISKMRRIRLTPEMLLYHGSGTAEKIRDPKKGKLLRLAIKILPSTVCMLFTASVVLSAKELNALTVIEGILKLSTLPIVGFRGYVNGYNYKKDSESDWLKTKTRLISGFLGQK